MFEADRTDSKTREIDRLTLENERLRMQLDGSFGGVSRNQVFKMGQEAVRGAVKAEFEQELFAVEARVKQSLQVIIELHERCKTELAAMTTDRNNWRDMHATLQVAFGAVSRERVVSVKAHFELQRRAAVLEHELTAAHKDVASLKFDLLTQKPLFSRRQIEAQLAEARAELKAYQLSADATVCTLETQLTQLRTAVERALDFMAADHDGNNFDDYDAAMKQLDAALNAVGTDAPALKSPTVLPTDVEYEARIDKMLAKRAPEVQKLPNAEAVRELVETARALLHAADCCNMRDVSEATGDVRAALTKFEVVK